jgi:hypothetical protein
MVVLMEPRGTRANVSDVLTYLVEHDDGVVERVAKDRQQADQCGRGHRETHEGVDADGQHHVVNQRDERCGRHLGIPEVDPNNQRDQCQEDR